MRLDGEVYLDYQASTPVMPTVMAAMEPYFTELYANPHASEHAGGWRAAEAVETAAECVANLLGADSDEVTFTSGATEANNLAILGTCRGNLSRNRRRVLVSAIEHKSVLEACRSMQNAGFAVDRIRVDSQGRVDLNHLEDLLGDDVLLVSVMAVNNEIGTVQDLRCISALSTKFGCVLHCDASQAPCAIELNHLAMHVDLISLSAHKMYGPKGIGALVIRRALQSSIEPLMYGGGQQHGLRPGTTPVPLCVGLGRAALFIAEAGESSRRAVQASRDYFIQELLKRKDFEIRLNGPALDIRHPGNAHMRFVGVDAEQLVGMLQPKLLVSTGAACSSGIPEPSHVLTAIGCCSAEAQESVRFSIGLPTTHEQVGYAVACISETLHRIRSEG